MRVHRCFAFLDLCGFTAFSEDHGDREAVAVLATLRGGIREEAEACGVRVTKWLGDGVMLSATDASAVHVCATRTVRFAMAAIPLQLRGGLAAGPVVMFEGDDYVGGAVNRAARLCASATGRQLRYDELLAEQLGLPSTVVVEPHPEPTADPDAAATPEVALPSRHGPLRMTILGEQHDAADAAVLIGNPRGSADALVYVHRACVLGDALGGSLCRSRRRLDAALRIISDHGSGVVVYRRDGSSTVGDCCLGGTTELRSLTVEEVEATRVAIQQLDLRSPRNLTVGDDLQRLSEGGVGFAGCTPLDDRQPAAA